jgi:hypothetical protein
MCDLAKSHMEPRYQYARTIQWQMNGKRRPSRDRNMSPPTSLLFAGQYYNKWPGELYIWGTVGSGIISHPWWWGLRWFSKRQFLLYIWCGCLPKRILLHFLQCLYCQSGSVWLPVVLKETVEFDR